MIGGNQDTRVEKPISLVTGPLVGQDLLKNFKDQILTQTPFQVMFGSRGERIFDDESPNLNETIVPALLLRWKTETFSSNNTYLEGAIDATICLPTRLGGDFNSLRRVGSMFQRFMGGAMNVFSSTPGLIMFGFGSEYNYNDLLDYSGFSVPAIQINIPFKFDLQLLRLQIDGFDPSAPLDDSDVGFVEEYVMQVINGENQNTLIEEGVICVTGQTN